MVEIGQVELAIDQAAGSVRIELRQIDRLAVDLNQPAPHHGQQLGLPDPQRGEHVGDRVALVGLDVDEKTIGRIRRCRTLPAVEQIPAGHRQQHQRHQPDRQGCGLCNRSPLPATPGCERHAQRGIVAALTDQVTQWRQQTDRKPRNADENHCCSRKAQDRHPSQLAVSRKPQQQNRKRTQGQQRCNPGGDWRCAEVSSQHPQRRHTRKSCQGHRRKAQQQQQTGHCGLYPGQHRGCGQCEFERRSGELHQHQMPEPADRRTDQATSQTQPQHLEQQGTEESGLGDANSAHHRTAVQMALGKSTSSHRNRHGSNQCSEQGHQCEKLLSAIQRGSQLGPAVIQRLHALASRKALCGPVLEGRKLVRIAGQQGAVGHATGRLHQPCRGQIGQGHHGPRCEVHEIGATIGLECNHPSNLKTPLAQMQRIADRHSQRLQQRRIDPDRAVLRDGVGRRIRPIEFSARAQGTRAADSPD